MMKNVFSGIAPPLSVCFYLSCHQAVWRMLNVSSFRNDKTMLRYRMNDSIVWCL